MVENNSISQENNGGKLKKVLDTLFKIAVVVGIIYMIYYVFKPTGITKMSKESKQKIDSLTTEIEKVEKKQEILYLEIKNLNGIISQIDTRIDNIKQEKKVIKEIYHEKINAVDTYNDAELDSIFAKRYYYPTN